MVRFAQRTAGYFNVRDRKLIKIGTTNIIDITNNNSLVTGTSVVPAIISSSTTGSCKRVVSPCKPLSIRAAHNAERIILTFTIIQSSPSRMKINSVTYLLLVFITRPPCDPCINKWRCFCGRGCHLLFCSTVMTTFPRACPFSRYRRASGTSFSV